MIAYYQSYSARCSDIPPIFSDFRISVSIKRSLIIRVASFRRCLQLHRVLLSFAAAFKLCTLIIPRASNAGDEPRIFVWFLVARRTSGPRTAAAELFLATNQFPERFSQMFAIAGLVFAVHAICRLVRRPGTSSGESKN